jgi:hypothetical protein
LIVFWGLFGSSYTRFQPLIVLVKMSIEYRGKGLEAGNVSFIPLYEFIYFFFYSQEIKYILVKI